MKSAEAKPWKYQQMRPWGCWERLIIGLNDDVYLDRLSLIWTPFFSIKFHRIYRPDRQRDLHDHPWSFLAFILRGSYWEDTVKGVKRRRWWNWKKATDRHSIRTVSRSPVWTLVICGPKSRSWGFWVEQGTKFIPWRDYDKLYGA